MHADFLVIGGGLSGLAAAIRLARYNDNVLLIEKHSRVGGLNSYYYRNNRLFETGLHAITNYADKTDKKAPLNRLLRQLKISRDEIGFQQQVKSEICFSGQKSLFFSNEFEEFREDIGSKFRHDRQGFNNLVAYLDSVNPFIGTAFHSTRATLGRYLSDPLLIDMLLCPVMFYGSSWENDIDLNQFVIMFRSLFQEGMFRPAGTIKDVLDLLVSRLEAYGGRIMLNSGVNRIVSRNEHVSAVRLDNGKEITCTHLLSTIGVDETRTLLGQPVPADKGTRLGFTETIFQLDESAREVLPTDRTCIFFSDNNLLSYQNPETPVDFTSGVICLPFNFKGLRSHDEFVEVRTTHLANYSLWKEAAKSKSSYLSLKKKSAADSLLRAESILGGFSDRIVYHDSFTPLTVERYTGKKQGAIYGSPDKVKDGRLGFENLFIAGTDQGFLGIVGSMLSGVSIVNQNILAKL